MGSVVDSVVGAIESLPPLAAYSIIVALVFAEAAIFIGFVLPGETAVLVGGFLASVGDLRIRLLCVLVVLAAVVGDSFGFEVGRYVGPRLLRLGPVRAHAARLDRGRDLLRRRGGPAVLLGRFTAFFRAVMPALAGLSRMRYRTFLFWNAVGGLVWGVGYCLIGYLAGSSYEQVAGTVGRASAIGVGALVVAGLVGWHVYRRRRSGHHAA